MANDDGPISCPFCGSRAVQVECCGNLGKDTAYAVVCHGCGARGGRWTSIRGAVQSWNKRCASAPKLAYDYYENSKYQRYGNE